MKILFAASELTPIAKVGGLGDVAGALPKALKALNQDIRVIIPYYEVIKDKGLSVELVAKDIKVKVRNKEEKVNLYQSVIPQSNVILYLLENYNYLSRDGIYFEKSAFVGGFKEIQRFLFFSKSILEIFKPLNWQPDIIHCQDWHTAILPALVKSQFPISNFQFPKILLTIHNLANQGLWNANKILNFLDLREKDWPTLKVQPLGPYGKNINLIQQGILNANLINTVSPTYAKEILTKEYGEGLEKTLSKRKKDLSGILNGIDVKIFNPETDPQIKMNYSLNNLEKKVENKLDLQKMVNLSLNKEIPILGFIGRLTNQKGLDLIYDIIDEIMEEECQLVFLGTGSKTYEKILVQIAKKYPKKISSQIKFDAQLAQKIYAGADMLLVPSCFEPCGLIQMIAMRYGTIPIVRETGGLKDTVKNFQSPIGVEDKFSIFNFQSNGFVFKKYNPKDLLKTIKEALIVYKNRKIWRQLQLNGMKKDFSWDKSAKEYLKLYNKLI